MSAKNPRTSRRPLRRRLLLAAVTVLLFFGVAEGVLRVAGFEDTSVVRWETVGVRGFEMVIEDSHMFEPDPELLWRLRSSVTTEFTEVPVRTNALGLRGPEIPDPKAAGEVRILCTGDSSVFGHGVAEEHGFPAQLQGQLRTLGGSQVRVINMGVPGYSTFQSLAQLRRHAPSLQPDVLVIYNAISDFYLDAIQDKDRFQSATVRGIKGLFGRSRTYQLLRRLFKPLAATRDLGTNPYATSRVSLADYRANLQQMVQLGNDHGALSVMVVAPVVLLPKRNESEVGEKVAMQYWTVMREVAAEYGMPVVDMHAYYGSRMRDERTRLFLDDCHPTRDGHHNIANQLRKTITENYGAGGAAGNP